MSDVFISYARSTADQAQAVAGALRALGHAVWIDDELPAHRAYTDVIEERLRSAKAVVVIWSGEAAKSHWVRAEANTALEAGTLVQLTIDGVMPPMPFNQIQCADMSGWSGDVGAPGWRKVVASIGELLGRFTAAPPVATASLPLPTKPSIAVLPFADMTGAEGQDYFVDGMVEEITMALSRSRSIFVIAGGSGLSFKGKDTSPQDAARQLGVRYVLEGSVRKAAGRVRIAVKLIDGADGSQLWADRFEDTLEDVFALQDRVALAVAGRIEPTVLRAEIQRASARPTENISSYELYLRAFPLVRTYVRADMLEALRLAERAAELDPNYAAALALVAECRLFIHLYGWSTDDEENLREGIEAGHRALKIAGDDPQVLSMAGAILGYLERDTRAAIALVDRGTALNPGSSWGWYCSGTVRLFAGETEAGIEHIERSIRLDPLGPHRTLRLIMLGWGRFQQQRFEAAASLLEEVAQETDSPGAYSMLAACYGHLGRIELARAALGHYSDQTSQPTGEFARSVTNDPRHLKLLMDGIALAEGKDPSEAEGGG